MWLEHRIPPPVIGILMAGAMWGVATQTPMLPVPAIIRAVVAIGLVLIGGGISVAGVVAFRRAQTTVNPLKPETATALVRSGICAITRNPMYLGMLVFLVAWAVWLSAPWAVAGPVAFALYMTRFQIIPEERALSSLFGAEYDAYRAQVRRWL